MSEYRSDVRFHEGARIVTMAHRALNRGRLIEENVFARDFANRAMALVAFHSGMSPLQRELGPLVMVENRRYPTLSIVTIGAEIFSRFGNELSTVGVQVTGIAFLGSAFELNLFSSGQRFVAGAASDGAMRPKQREFCLAVIKAGDLGPGSGIVASFAAERRAVGALSFHSVAEFAVVRILVAGGTGFVGELKGQDLVCAIGHACFVAIVAGNRGV